MALAFLECVPGGTTASWVHVPLPLKQWPPYCSGGFPQTGADLRALPPQLCRLPHPVSTHPPLQCSGRNLGVCVAPARDCQHVLPLLQDLPPQHISHIPMSQGCHLRLSSGCSRLGPWASGVGFGEIVRNTEGPAPTHTSHVRPHVTLALVTLDSCARQSQRRSPHPGLRTFSSLVSFPLPRCCFHVAHGVSSSKCKRDSASLT